MCAQTPSRAVLVHVLCVSGASTMYHHVRKFKDHFCINKDTTKVLTHMPRVGGMYIVAAAAGAVAGSSHIKMEHLNLLVCCWQRNVGQPGELANQAA